MGGYLKMNWETFPMEQLKRVDEPTTKINEAQKDKNGDTILSVPKK